MAIKWPNNPYVPHSAPWDYYQRCLEACKKAVEEGALVPLDEKKVLGYLLSITPRSVPLDKEEIESLAKRLSTRFGQPKPRNVPTDFKDLVKELKLLKSYFEDSREVLLHVNDIKWKVIDDAIHSLITGEN